MTDTTMGNQPPSSCSLKGWLAGIIDGEGCLQLAHQRYKDRYHYRPQLVIGNTNPLIIEKIREIAIQNDLPVYFQDRGFAALNSKSQTVALQIMGLKRVKKWLDFITPYLYGKKQQAEIISNYIDYRLSQPNPTKGKPTFGDKDREYRIMLDTANHQYRASNGSTTTRRT